MTDEEFYDQEVAPVLLDLAKKHEARGLPFFALAGWDRDEGRFGLTQTFDPDRWNDPHTPRFVSLCLRTRNIEQIGFAWAKYVQREKLEHSSCVLRLLGVEPRVEDRK